MPLGLWQRDGAGGLERAGRGFARRELLRREVIHRDGGSDGGSGGAEFFRFGVGELVLRARLVDVEHVRLAHAIA